MLTFHLKEKRETFERDNENIALNVLPVLFNKKTINLQYKSKHNPTKRYYVVLLTITDNIKWHYLALKSISTNDGFVKPIQYYLDYLTK